MRELAVLCLLAAACDGGAEEVPDAECAISADCDFGSFCDAGVCAEGCRENGDCGYSVPCIGGACDDTPGACNGEFYCEYGEACDPTTRGIL